MSALARRAAIAPIGTQHRTGGIAAPGGSSKTSVSPSVLVARPRNHMTPMYVTITATMITIIRCMLPCFAASLSALRSAVSSIGARRVGL